MKYRLYCLFSFLWFFKWLSLPVCHGVAVTQTIRNQTLSVVDIFTVNVTNPRLLSHCERDGISFTLISTMAGTGSVLKFSSDVLSNVPPSVLKGNLYNPKDVQVVPKDIFKFPAFLIADGDYLIRAAHGRLTLVDVSDIYKPRFYDITTDKVLTSIFEFEYGNPVWLSQTEFLVCRAASVITNLRVRWELVHFRANVSSLTGLWNGVVLEIDSCRFPMVLVKDVWNSLDVLYTVNFVGGSFGLLWSETVDGKPGDWRNPDEIFTSHLITKESYMDVKLVDLNKDGKLDLLVSVASGKGQVRAYQIPMSNEFRNISNYRLITLLEDYKNSSKTMCPKIVKTFNPFYGYKGKPWILISGDICGSAAYLAPESEDPDNWDYKFHRFLDDARWVTDVEAMDIDGDGLVELFVALRLDNMIKAYSIDYPFDLSSIERRKLRIAPRLRVTASSVSLTYFFDSFVIFVIVFLLPNLKA